jgi:hypothetical protein
MCDFSVREHGGRVLIEPSEGGGSVRRYFEAHRLADAATDLTSSEPWRAVMTHPPYEKPSIGLPTDFESKMADLASSTALPQIIERLNVKTSLATEAELPDVLREELPGLFERYPQGSLWFVSVDQTLMKRLAALRVLLQLYLTPDVPVDRGRAISYLTAHQLTHGAMFAGAVQPILLALSPTAIGFTMNAAPHAFVFLFGELEDLRIRDPGGLARAFFPGVHNLPAVPGVKVPMDKLATAHLEVLLSWWTTRLNVLYSHAADPTQFALPTGEHDVAAQAGWFLTFERMLADFGLLGSAVDSPGLLRLQGAFDALDKAASLLKKSVDDDPQIFKSLLNRSVTLPRVHQAYQKLPLQLQPRFSSWAERTFARFYDEIRSDTMPSRRTALGIKAGNTSPGDLRELSWDEYVGMLVREARNASHGLMDAMAEPRRPGRFQRRLLLATSNGEMPASLYELTRVILFGLLADAESLCQRSW